MMGKRTGRPRGRPPGRRPPKHRLTPLWHEQIDLSRYATVLLRIAIEQTDQKNSTEADNSAVSEQPAAEQEGGVDDDK